MNKLNHTSGPWTAVILARGEPKTIGGRTHSTISRRECRIVSGSGEEVANINLRPDENVANASLMAASPELLAACQRIYEEIGNGLIPDEFSEESKRMLESAIAKAKKF